MKTLKFKRRALVLATVGLMAGSALSLATKGVLQPAINVPVQIIEDLSAGAYPSQLRDKNILVLPAQYTHYANAILFLTSDTFEKLEHRQVVVKSAYRLDIDILIDAELSLISETVSQINMLKVDPEQIADKQKANKTKALLLFALQFDELYDDDDRNV